MGEDAAAVRHQRADRRKQDRPGRLRGRADQYVPSLQLAELGFAHDDPRRPRVLAR